MMKDGFCTHCGVILPEKRDYKMQCDRICRFLHKIYKGYMESKSETFELLYIDRAPSKVKRMLIDFPLNACNSFYKRRVSEEEFTGSIKTMLSYQFKRNKFYSVMLLSYYHACLKTCNNFITLGNFLKGTIIADDYFKKKARKIALEQSTSCTINYKVNALLVRTLENFVDEKNIKEEEARLIRQHALRFIFHLKNVNMTAGNVAIAIISVVAKFLGIKLISKKLKGAAGYGSTHALKPYIARLVEALHDVASLKGYFSSYPCVFWRLVYKTSSN